MYNWYKISQDLNVFVKLDEISKHKEQLKEQVETLSQQYLDYPDDQKDQATEFYERVVNGPRKEYRQVRQEWEREAKKLVSQGLLTIEDAKERGYWSSGHESDGWKPLPEVLYHVTTAKSKVVVEGLKSRDELNQTQGAGLGGGESNTISYTESLETAYNIIIGLLEMKRVQEGKLTVQDMISLSKAGTGADRPYFKEFYEHCDRSWDIESKLTNQTSQSGLMGEPPDDDYDWQPVKGTGWEGRDKMYYGRWKRYRTLQEAKYDTERMYNAFSTFREQAGGREYPLFFSADSSKLEHLPVSEISILQFKPKPGAMGYQLHALGEWRTGTGANVDFVQEIPTPEYLAIANTWYDKMQRTSFANRWIPSVNNPENQLDYVFNCVGISQNGPEMDIIELMDENNDWVPNKITIRYLERFVGAMEDDYALSFKYCLHKGQPYVCAYFSAIHYVFKVSA